MRILIGADVPPDPNSGAAGTVWHTTAALRELGHEVDEFWADDLGRRIKHGNLHYLLELPYHYRRVVSEKCSKKTYDVIQLSQPYAWAAARDHRQKGKPGLFINRSHGLELLADAHESEWRKKLKVPENGFPRSLMTVALRRMLHKQTRKIARYCDGVVVPAADIRDCLISTVGMSERNIAVIPHGVQDSFLTRPPKEMTATRARKILYVGQFAFIKGPHILARILEQVLPAHPELSMTWVCSRKHHDAVRVLLPASVAQRVELVDWVEQERLAAIYDAHGLFCFPSLYEGAGKAALEAMARGLCVFASDVGSMRDLIRDGENGFTAAIGDVRGFVNKIAMVLDHLELGRRVSENARTTAAAYSWRRCAEAATGFYRQLINNGKEDGTSKYDRCPSGEER